MTSAFVIFALGRWRALARETTERNRTEEALRESEERFRRLSDASLEGIAILENGIVLDANERFTEVFGYPLAEVVGMHAVDFTAPESRDLVSQNIKSQHDKPYEALALRKDGSIFPVEVCGKPIPHEGRMLRVTAIRDVTERKRAEEALRESEERYRDLVENINDIIFEVDAGGRITYVSPIVEETAGYKPSEIVGRSFTEFVHPDDLPGLAESLQKGVSGNPVPSEYRVLSKTGKMRWVRSFSRPIFDGDRIVGLRGVLTDITERKRAEEALRKSEERYRTLVDNLNDIVYEVDPAGRITYVNQAAEGAGGYTRSEIVDRLFTDFLHPDDQHRFVDNFQRHISSGVSSPHEYRLLSKTGETLWFRSNGRPIFEGARFVGFRGVLTDITERKRMEEALEKAREELEARVEYQMLRRNPYGLTFRELTVLHLVAAGESDKEIGLALGISPLTAQKHISNILDKMEAASRTEAGVRAVREGLLD